MEYHISFDSGGSKLVALLYDEEFHLIASARTGSVRDTYTPRELVLQNVEKCLRQLLAGRDIRRIGQVRGCFTGDLIEALKERGEVCFTVGDGEARMGLAAAGITGDGLLALAGTGATLFYQRDDCRGGVMGGYGAVVFDEGSGYHIGRLALAAAIRYNEGRGSKTVLEERITQFFGGQHFRGAVFSIYSNPDTAPIAAVASLAPLVSKAAYEGDALALEIYERAGFFLGDQMNALIRQHQVPQTVPIAVSGGVWKGHPSLYRRFLAQIRLESPERPVKTPYFEPVVGGILAHYLEQVGSLDEKALAFFQKEYTNYKFYIGEDHSCLLTDISKL